MTIKIGMGLGGVGGYAIGANLGYGTQEQPFLNLFKACNGWRGVGNITARQYTFDHMNLDGSGYPTNKNIISPSGRDTTFNYFRATIFFQNGWYDYNSTSFINGGPAGRYVILWSGPGTLTLAPGSDGTYTSVATGRAFVDVRSPSGAGIILQNDARSGFNAVTNVRVVYSPDASNRGTGAGGSTTPGVNGTGTHEALLNSGEVFNQRATLLDGTVKGIPFLDRLRDANFSPFRFMDWFVTTSNTWVNFSDRVAPPYALWLFVPYEVAVALCNKLSRDMWLNLPMCASSTFITNLVSLINGGGTDSDGTVWAGLNSNLNIYVEDGNEVWNAPPNFNNNIVQNQSRISQSYAAYPGFKTANLRCDFQGSIASDGVGTGTSTLTVSSINSGSIFINILGGGGQGSIWDPNNLTLVLDGSYVTAQLTGSPRGTGTYTILHEQTVGSRRLTQGDDYAAFVQNHIRRTIVYGNTFKATFGSRCIITMGGQVGGATASYTTALATAFGGNGSDWSGPSGRAMDAYATAPYFGSGAWCTSIPNSATPAQVVQELTDSSVYGIYIPFGTGSCSGTTLTITALNPGNPAPFLYPGAPITSPGFQPGCTVVTQLSGATGGIGTYTVSTSQTVGAGSTISGPVGAVAEQGVQSFIDWRIANSFGKLYVCYECGQSLVSSDNTLKTTFMNAQRQSGFYNLYKLYFQTLNNVGGSVACHFVDASPYTLDSAHGVTFGYWGALENIVQTTSAADKTPPKWRALVDFANGQTPIKGSGRMKTLMLPPKFKLGAALLGLLYKNPIMTRRGKISDH